MITEAIIVTALTIGILLPGVVLSFRIFRDELDLWRNIIIGSALGLVLLIDLNVLLSFLDKISKTSIFLAIFFLYIVSILISYPSMKLRRRGRPFGLSGDFDSTPSLTTSGGQISNLSQGERRGYGHLFLVGILAWSVTIRFWPLLFSQYPLGWDTTFHSLISKIIVIKGILPTTWEPFEKAILNYPWGIHAVMANVNLLSGIEIHRIFGIFINIVFAGLSVLAIYLLARQFFGTEMPAIFAAFAYGLLANLGSLDYYRWGGLPNQVGMFLFLCVSFVLLNERINFAKKLILGGFLLSGIVLVHHHAMLTSFFILFFYAFIVSISQRKITKETYSIIIMIALGLLFSGFYSWRFLQRVFAVQGTSILRFKESLSIFKMTFIDIGTLFIIFAIFGLIWFQERSSKKYIYHLSWMGSLLFAFLVGYYVWKVLTKITLGEAFVAFTPSRFLTDLVYPLSIFAGFGIYRAIVFFREKYSLILTVLCVIFLSLVPVYYVSGLRVSAISRESIQTLLWVKNNTPKGALVVNEGLRNDWAPYITEREVTNTPLPVTEFLNQYQYSKYELASVILGNKEYTSASRSKIIDRFTSRKVYLYISTPQYRDYLVKEFQRGDSFIYKVDMSKIGQM